MIDIKDLRSNPEPYRQSVKARGANVDIDKLLKLDTERAKQMVEIEGLRSKLKVKGKPTSSELKTLKTTKSELAKLETKSQKLETEYQDLLWQIPNLLSAGTPVGGEDANEVERSWGKAARSEAVDHLTYATVNGWLDFERGAKVAGNKFYFMKGPLVKLEMALKRLALDILEKDGFTLMDVPHMVNSRVAAGTGFLPRGQERQVYKIEGEDLNLIATAEMPISGYHADEILEPAELPLAYAGWSPSYRLEAGAYGKHSKGLYRVHQFNKLEMYVFCSAQDSDEWLQKLVGLQEKIAQKLEIPYRVTRTASGDTSAPAYQKYDLEYWSPAEGEYRELTSASNCTDFQARRLNIRVRGENGNQSAHTLNGTAVAISRTIIAILENHQRGDRIKLPKQLAKYYGAKFL